MGDDDGAASVGNFLGQAFRGLVDIDDDVGRRHGVELFEIDLFGAADAAHFLDAIGRMDTEGGASDHLIPEAEVEQQLGDAWYQRGDARSGGGQLMEIAGGVDQVSAATHRASSISSWASIQAFSASAKADLTSPRRSCNCMSAVVGPA